MLRTIMIIAALMAPSAVSAQSRDCPAKWKEADTDGNGTLTKQEDRFGYIDAVRGSGRKLLVPDVLSRDEFILYCEGSLANTSAGTREHGGPGGAVDPSKGSMTPGLVPFPKDQAMKRLEAAGYRDVGELALDDKGIWRTTVTFNGKRIPVAVDVKGDVLAGG